MIHNVRPKKRISRKLLINTSNGFFRWDAEQRHHAFCNLIAECYSFFISFELVFAH